MADASRAYWTARFILNDASEHLLLMLGANDRAKIEKVWERVERNYRNNFPASSISLQEIRRVESPTQVEEEMRKIRDRHPHQLGEYAKFSNPNFLLFRNPPRRTRYDTPDQSALIDFLCGGGF